MRIRFWGTRGSLPKPGPTTLRYGGNTSCVEVRTDDGTLLVFDCGTGVAQPRAGAAQASGEPPDSWPPADLPHPLGPHPGVPVLRAAVRARERVGHLRAGRPGPGAGNTLAGQMQYTYFPVALDQLGATIRYHDLGEGTFEIGPARVTAQYLNHPALALGYRVEVGGAVAGLRDRSRAARGLPGRRARHGRRTSRSTARTGATSSWLAGADLVIHDSQYTDREYPEKKGWGHTTIEWSVEYALAARAKCLVLFHHEPLRDDDGMDRVLAMARERAGSALDVVAAIEGQVIELPERPAEAAAPAGARPARRGAETGPVRWAADSPDRRRRSRGSCVLLQQTLRKEGLRLLDR